MTFDSWLWDNVRTGTLWQIVTSASSYRALVDVLRRTGEPYAGHRLASGNWRLLSVEPITGTSPVPVSGRSVCWVLSCVLVEPTAETGGPWRSLLARFRTTEAQAYAN